MRMKCAEFVARIEAIAGVTLIGDQTERVIALAKEHKGGVILNDLEICLDRSLAVRMGFSKWLDQAEINFPVAPTIIPATKEDSSGDLFETAIMQRLETLKKEGMSNER